MLVSFLERCPWLLSGPALLPSPFPLPDLLNSATATPRAETLMRRSCTVLVHFIATGTVAGVPNKMFITDDPRQAAGRLRGIFHPDLDPLSITPALGIPLFLPPSVARYLCCCFQRDQTRAACQHRSLQYRCRHCRGRKRRPHPLSKQRRVRGQRRGKVRC